ncbi:MAG: hypothetical protein WC868_05400 [Bacteroidales bacterium]
MSDISNKEIILNKEQFRIFNFDDKFGLFQWFLNHNLILRNHYRGDLYTYETLKLELKTKGYEKSIDDEFIDFIFGISFYFEVEVDVDNNIYGVKFEYNTDVHTKKQPQRNYIINADGAYDYACKIRAIIKIPYFQESEDYYPILLIPVSIIEKIQFPNESEIVKKHPTIQVPKKLFPPFKPCMPKTTKIIYKNKLEYYAFPSSLINIILFWGILLLLTLCAIFFNQGIFALLMFPYIYIVWSLFKGYTKVSVSEEVKIPESEYQESLERYYIEEKAYPEKVEKYNNELERYKIENEKYLDDILKYGVQIIKEEYKYRLHPNEKPKRPKAIQRKGNSEMTFLEKLLVYFPNDNIKVNMSLGDFDPPYSPDFVYVCEKTNLHIDIEIDEKYAFDTKEPIHFIDGADDARNQFFLDSKWVVIRFCEEQILKYPTECCKFIADVVRYISNPFSEASSEGSVLIDFPIDFPRIKRWSYEEAFIDGHKDSRSGSNKPSITDLSRYL